MRYSPLPQPQTEWLQDFFCDGLWGGGTYTIDRTPCRIKLDQNEASWDWPEAIKKSILQRCQEEPWNKYPDPYVNEVLDAVSQYSGFAVDNLIIGPGSHHLLCLALSIFRQRRRGQLVISRPSFPLYESHAKNFGLEKRIWPLTQDFEFETESLHDLPAHSYVVFASPNNPVGNVLAKEHLEALLQAHPHSMFFADEAYFEYSPEPYTELVQRYPNLILLRTLSKAFASAGIRLGYMIGSQPVIDMIRKVTLPYLVNRLAAVTVQQLLTDTTCLQRMRQQVEQTMVERDKTIESLIPIGREKGFCVYPSHGNFFLQQWEDAERARTIYTYLRDECSILVRDVSRGPLLDGCLRVTVGCPEENQAFVTAMRALAS
ncbi:MAG: histidinol-phosphate transaminase [Zetaproteobacteria bacterium]|nr:histidinol-phosphate transaminase [Zetaproteobacteria bacterium]